MRRVGSAVAALVLSQAVACDVFLPSDWEQQLARREGGKVMQLAAAGGHTCALLETGSVRCWGLSANGRLGYGNGNKIGDDETPASAGNVEVGGSVEQISAMAAHTCALLDTGKLRCWGDGSYGQLGYANTNNVGGSGAPQTPMSAGDVNVGGTVAQVATGGDHTCALLESGKLRCWGYGADGRLGYGNVNDIGDNETPASAGDVSVGGTVMQAVAGGDHSCALLSGGNIRCWGGGSGGQPGYGNTNSIGDNETPASAGDVNVGGKVTQLAAGGSHTCALLDTGKVRCWGVGTISGTTTSYTYGTLGYGHNRNIGDDETPASAGDVDVGGTVVSLVAGWNHNCVLLDTGRVRCWGKNADGQLGYGNTNNIGDDETPASAGDVDVGGTVTQIAAGSSHTCALLDTGRVRCWGLNNGGQLGYGHTRNIGDDETPANAGDAPVW